MEELLNLEAVTSILNLKRLRHLYDSVETRIRNLRSLGISSDSYGSLLASVLLNRLPPELRVIVTREITDEEWNLAKVMEIFQKELDACERAAVSTTSTFQGKKPVKDGCTNIIFTTDWRFYHQLLFLWTVTHIRSLCEGHRCGSSKADTDQGRKMLPLLAETSLEQKLSILHEMLQLSRKTPYNYLQQGAGCSTTGTTYTNSM